MKVSSCNLDEIILVEKGVTCRRADGGQETNGWCIRKVTTRTYLQNIVKCPGDSERYLMEHGKRTNFLYLSCLGDNAPIIWKHKEV